VVGLRFADQGSPSHRGRRPESLRAAPMFPIIANPPRPAADLRGALAALALLAFGASDAPSQAPPAPERKLFDGVVTNRPVPGAPYELAGKRVVFANWYYIQPGDLDWRDSEGKSVYVSGDEGPFGAHHVAIRAPHGIRIAAEKPQVVGPF